jgi:hypothetical protein
MEYLVIWIFFSLIVSLGFGHVRRIGFWYSFIFCLLLSPIIGFFITIFSPTNESIRIKNHELRVQAQQLEEMKKMASVKPSLADELKKISELKDSGAITDAEYNQLKNKIICD